MSLDYRADVSGRGAEVFHAIRSCHQWAAGSPVPALVRRMQLVQFCSVTDELVHCPFAQNTEKSGLSTLHTLLRCGLIRISCTLTRLLISLRFANGVQYKDVSYP